MASKVIVAGGAGFIGLHLAVEHRISVKVKPQAEMDDLTPKIILERAVERVPVPKLEI